MFRFYFSFFLKRQSAPVKFYFGGLFPFEYFEKSKLKRTQRYFTENYF